MMTKNIASGKRTLKQRGKKTALQLLAACSIFAGAGMMQSCEKDILLGQPEWLGNSIYERLQEGIVTEDGQKHSFNITLQLINDLGYTETLSKTGSKTIFAVPDDIYDQWFQSNAWKVKSYNELSPSQKKVLFNNAMIDNAYLVDLMTNVTADPPVVGMAMRRETAASILDTIPVMYPQDMPVDPMNDVRIDSWKTLREENKPVYMAANCDNPTMIHFLPQFMQKNNITDNDLQILSNGVSQSTTDSWVNGKKVISAEQTCKNGYIYVLNGVMDGNKNMAQIISSEPEMTRWASLLNRFSAPFPYQEPRKADATGQHNMQVNIGVNFDNVLPVGTKVYELRYFNNEPNCAVGLTPESNNSLPVSSSALLKFDPAWNSYIYSNSMGYDIHYDAAAMFVPTNTALEDWWNYGAGQSLKEEYKEWNLVPYGIIAELLNVNMQKSFVSSVPSKFGSVLDDAKIEMRIKPSDIERCYVGTNGVVYLTRKVFSPSSYRSVVYPAIAHQTGTLAAIYKAIYDYDFKPFLTSMDSKFSLVLPYNTMPNTTTTKYPAGTQQVFRYLDPTSYGQTYQRMLEIFVEESTLKANGFKCTVDEAGTITYNEGDNYDVTTTVINNRLQDLVDNLIIVGEIWSGKQSYYKTKGGSVIKVKLDGKDVILQGGFQQETGQEIRVPEANIFDQRNAGAGEEGDGNGITYCLDPTYLPPLTAKYSVYQALQQQDMAGNNTIFYALLDGDPATTADGKDANPIVKNEDKLKNECADADHNRNILLFDKYNYTVYVPSDAALAQYTTGDEACLPTWADYEEYKELYDVEKEKDSPSTALMEWYLDCMKVISDRIHNFIKYHVQDNSVYIDGDQVVNTKYETGMLNTKNNRFFSVTVNADKTQLTVTDQLNKTYSVQKNNLWNKTCCEYWIKGTGGGSSETCSLYSTSHAVVHEINGALFFSADQLKPWRSLLKPNPLTSSAKSSRR